jgi:hypothetical protein
MQKNPAWEGHYLNYVMKNLIGSFGSGDAKLKNKADQSGPPIFKTDLSRKLYETF